MSKRKMNNVERDLVEGLEEFRGDLKSGRSIKKKYKVCRVNLKMSRLSLSRGRIKNKGARRGKSND